MELLPLVVCLIWHLTQTYSECILKEKRLPVIENVTLKVNCKILLDKGFLICDISEHYWITVIYCGITLHYAGSIEVAVTFCKDVYHCHIVFNKPFWRPFHKIPFLLHWNVKLQKLKKEPHVTRDIGNTQVIPLNCNFYTAKVTAWL